ncbi:epigen-like [Cololabis saira]|uniref:epigen-like n=1 Tax=Cololabis saira TaxID=129043 RepID=UPI002AD53BA0|nr:epigen-like [Cololabis saira]
MFMLTQTNLQKALVSAVTVLLLLIAPGQSEDLQATAAPLVLNSSLTTGPSNSSMEKPKVQALHLPCGSEHDAYCANGGQCMYPQDSNKPSCICTDSYSGPRCMVPSALTHSQPGLEKVIAITFGVIMVVCILAIIILRCVYKKCVKETPLKTKAMTQTLV